MRPRRGQRRLFLTPIQAAVEARLLVALCESHLRQGQLRGMLPGFIQELHRLESEFGTATLYGDADWLDRYSTVLQAYRELAP